MKLTKYEHACFTLEKDDQMLVVDPGNLSSDFLPSANTTAIVLTHAHPDHSDHEQIAAIIDKNPEAVIVGHPDVIAEIEVFKTQSVNAGDKLTIGVFNLEFFGGTHALIHRSKPPVANLGVLINELLYYPGDSFTLPGRDVDTLALPAGGPWMKTGEAMDFLEVIKPRFAFPTHDAVLSDIGKGMADAWFTGFSQSLGIEYQRLEGPIDV
jgi:L-ascorbate metabolism protein UlaG (beta-lactamase superfamily)